MNRFSAAVCSYYEGSPKDLVGFDEAALVWTAELLALEDPLDPAWNEEEVLPKGVHPFISHSFYLCAIDFGTKEVNQPDVKYRVGRHTGSMALAHCFYRRFGEHDILPEDILAIAGSREKAEEFFRGENLPSLIDQRRECLREAALVLKERYFGQSWNILLKAGYRLFGTEDRPGIVEILVEEFPKAFGQDVYDPVLRFYKRAQLWPLIYQGRALNSLSGDGLGYYLMPRLEDPETFGPVMDYRVPAALRDLGILTYAEPLAAKVDSRTVLERHSAEELAIRIAGIYAVEKLIRAVNDLRSARGKKPWTMVAMDFRLFMLGRESERPHHLCSSTDY